MNFFNRVLSLLVFVMPNATTGAGTRMAKSAKGQIGPEECFGALIESGYDLADFANYGNFFEDTSVMTLAQAGSYYGVDGIAEYVLFAFNSPYINFNTTVNAPQFVDYDKKSKLCTFINPGKTTYVTNSMTTNTQISELAVSSLVKIFLNYKTKKVEKTYVYYTEHFLSFFFGNLTNTDQSRSYVCSVHQLCNFQYDTCESTLAALPISTDGLYVDGNSQGCRILHSAFAPANPKHCAHIAFDPTPDTDGEIKCQASSQISPDDLFDETDFEVYRDFQTQVGIDPDIGYTAA